MKKQQQVPRTRISRHGLLWTFGHIISNARDMTNHSEWLLKDSVDMDGTSHRKSINALVANMKLHLDAMDAFLQEQEP